MYSLVLMTTLTTAPDMLEFGGNTRNWFFGGGCNGSSASPAGCIGSSASPAGCAGYSAPRYSCMGGGCSGSTAYAGGCDGGGGLGSRVRRWFDRGGCCGGSGSGYGCSGSGYGCSGSGYSCFGTAAYSCFGGPAVSYTPVMSGGLSCQGGHTWSAPPPTFNTYPAYPGMPGVPGSGPPPSIPYAPPEVAPGPTGPQAGGVRPATGTTLVSGSGAGSARATVIVKLPADARLYADAKLLNLTGAERKFVSPELPSGQDFTYRFRAEYERDGETVSVTKKVPVRAGGSVNVEFTDLTAKAVPEKGSDAKPVAAVPTSAKTVVESPVANTPSSPAGQNLVVNPPSAPGNPGVNTPGSPPLDRATITVRLPVSAVLYVDDRRSPSQEPVRQFSTPLLPTGREFAYLVRIEFPRNGQTETFTQKVPFRAGERVELDFSSIGR